MTRRLSVSVLLLLALLGAGLWAAPRVVDWEAWRGRLADIASARLGRPVALEGPIALVLLPNPRVEAGAVAVGDAGDGVTVRARAMRLRLDLAALLALRLEPREIVLVGGEIRLPWPPGALPSFRPPPWLTVLDARLEDCRVLVGGLELEKVDARLVTGGATEALVAEGSFAWRGQAVRFSGQLGRAGADGIAPLDLGLAVGGATLSARGVLLPAGGYEGRLEAAGPDLSALVPAPAVPFRATTSRFTAAADLLAADDLSLDLGGQPARGAVTLRLDPAPRLDITLNAGRLDLDAWVAALRAALGRDGAAERTVPVSVDLSAEATSLAGVPLRRLRGGAFLQGERLTLSDVSAVLPGETTVELAGATAGARLEAALQFVGNDLRSTLEALGLPLAGTDPARLRSGEGRFRLALQEGEAAFSDLVATVDGARVTGAGVLRSGPRPSVGLGLVFDRLDLDGLLPADASEWPALAARAAAGVDLNLRLAAERVSWRGVAAGRAALDAATEAGRLALRRLAFRLGEVDVVASGNAALGQTPRLSDVNVELNGADGAALRALLPAGAAELLPLDGQPVALRLSGGGPPEALALRAEGEMGDLRAEASGTLDVAAPQRPRVSGATLTARHPGAPRLLAPLLGGAAEAWFGQGSFALIASSLNADARAVGAENFDLVAGEMRLRGTGVTVALDGPRPRITGRLAAERLPLPALAGRNDRPLELRRLAALDAEVALEAARVEAPGLPVLEGVSAAVNLSAGTLRLDNFQARLGGGTLRGGLTVEGAAEPPRVALDAALAGAAIAGPVFGGVPLDLVAGKADGRAELAASGHGPAAMLATLGGALAFSVRGGILTGYDLGAVQAAAVLPDLAEAEAALRRALEGGATDFERLEGTARFLDGRATLEGVSFSTESGAVATATGAVDAVGREGAALDLRIAARPIAEAPEVGLRIAGPAAEPRRLPELAPFLRWRAER
ncbi:AsmA family protein [Craurococcus roseus]|uniref:AsmA family protein n=1 Tax=Craurococcus roseus TaxID=77585 RepID=A0ABP3PWV4_9PROT